MPRYRRASEIGQFVYCQRAWWLRQGLGLPAGNAEARRRGERAHADLGRDVRRSAGLRRLALLLLILAIALLAMGLL